MDLTVFYKLSCTTTHSKELPYILLSLRQFCVFIFEFNCSGEGGGEATGVQEEIMEIRFRRAHWTRDKIAHL